MFLRIGFLSTTRRTVDRVFDISLSLTLVGFLLSFYDWALVSLRLVALTALSWALMSYAMQWIYGSSTKEDPVRFRWYIHLLGLIVAIVIFSLFSVIFQEDIDVLNE